MKQVFFCVTCFLFALTPFGWTAEKNEITVAFWNVENLFDPADDPDSEGDDPYTPGGWAEWTDKRYKKKLENLAEVVGAVKPDILCLAEVENRKVLDDLASVLSNRFDFFIGHIVHRDGGDFRGIDVAVMARCAPLSNCWFTAVSGQRDVLVCDFRINGRDLAVMVNHWKSKLGRMEESDAIRTREAQAVRGFIDSRLAADPAASIVVTGDFNSDIDSSFLTESAGFATDIAALQGPAGVSRLFNLASELSGRERATYYYVRGDTWNSFDSISVTRGMLGFEPKAHWQVKPGSYKVYNPGKVTFRGFGSPLPFRRVRSKKYGDRYVEGYSDHFAVYAVLVAGE